MMVRVWYWRLHRGRDDQGNPTSVRPHRLHGDLFDERRDVAEVEVDRPVDHAMTQAIKELTGDDVIELDGYEEL